MTSTAVVRELGDVAPAEGRSVSARSGRDPASGAPEPNLHIETLDSLLARGRRPSSLPLSIGLHVVALVAFVAVPLLTSQDLPEPTTAVRAFFVEPAAVVPPPPPPPPPARRVAPRSAVRPPEPSSAFAAPVEVPEEIRPEQGLDVGVAEGMPGGVEGGIAGGVVGGIVGGLAEAAPREPVRVGGVVKPPTKLKNVDPEYPELARQARARGVVIIEALIGPDGRVREAKVLRSVPLLDAAALTAVRQWVYSPTLVGGVPVPVLMTITVNFNLIF
jgi:protein TonB